MAKFRTKARAIELLGKNQIADLPTAITELWKNGYDAYGDILNADLYEKGYKLSKNYIFTISDDGHGMSKYDLENKWIVIGTDSKKDKRNITPSQDRFGKEERVFLGEKGIGRLSVTYMGDHMLLITRKQGMPYEILFMNWRILLNYNLYLEDINIPMATVDDLSALDFEYKNLIKEYKKNLEGETWDDFQDIKRDILDDLGIYCDIPGFLIENIKKHYEKYGHGTYFVIFDPIEEIQNIGIEDTDDMSEEERKKISENNQYIRSVLSALFNPFDEELYDRRKKILGDKIDDSPKFTIHKRNGEETDYLKLNEFFTTDEFENCENWIKGNFNEYGEFNGKIKVLGNMQEYFYKPQSLLKKTKFGKIELKLAFWEGDFKNSIMPKEQWSVYDKKGKIYSGMYVYRDGFRVLPYGRTDFDFLEFELRRSKSAGYYYFSHRKMFGYIGITRKENPKLIDKSGREGFVSNPTYKEMKSALVDFFITIAKEKYGSESEGRQEHLGELAAKKEKDKIVAMEKKRNADELLRFRKLLRDNTEKLKTAEKSIKQIKNLIDSQYGNRKILKKEQTGILNKINELESSIMYLKIVPPPRVALTDEDKDRLYDYEYKRTELKKILEICNLKVMKNTYVNELKDQYTNRYKEVYESLCNTFYDLDGRIAKKVEEIKRMYSDNKKSETDKISKLSPTKIDIDNISYEETADYLKKLNEMYERVYTEQKEVLIPFVDYFEKFDMFNNDQKLIGIYKTSEKKLSEKVDELHELAQLGMAIEIIDHQFNVLYDRISSLLINIAPVFKKYNNDDMEEQYNSLKISFQHLESNHKLLVPLYRTTRRNKKTITGKEIGTVIQSFFGKIFEKDNISFCCDGSFLRYSFYTFESIINPVFINIINNAVYWVKLKSEREIRIECNEKNEVLIMNSGEKMTYTDLTNCFKLFFSRKPAGRGIGLYLAKTNLRSVGLDIYATNDEKYNKLGGACFVICNYEGDN